MTEKKITKRERFEEIKSILVNMDGAEELVDFVENEIALLDKKAAKAKATTAAKKEKSDELLAIVQEALGDEFATIDEIVSRITDVEVSNSKVSSRLSTLAKEGIAEKGSITIPGTDGQKARKLVAYKIVNE